MHHIHIGLGGLGSIMLGPVALMAAIAVGKWP